jgi:hypothetical protein
MSFKHGGDRRHVGGYPTAEEAAKFKELCKQQGTTQSKQIVLLIRLWIKKVEKQLESEK